MAHHSANTRKYEEGSPLYLLLLDWEKAVDRVTHEALFSALERMQLPDKIVNVVKALYRNTTFQVCMDNYESEWHRQDAGIRQGCPLSPYLSLNYTYACIVPGHIEQTRHDAFGKTTARSHL